MPIIHIPNALRSYTNGEIDIQVKGKTVGEAVSDLTQRCPALHTHLYDRNSELRPFVNLFLNLENTKNLQGLDTPLGEHDRLLLVPSIAGG